MEGTKEERIKHLLEILQGLQKEVDELKKEVAEDHIKQLERIEKKHQAEVERINKQYQERKEIRENELREHIDMLNELRSKYGRDVQEREVTPGFVPQKVDLKNAPQSVKRDNRQYAGRRFGLIMSLNESDYNNGEKIDLENDQLLFGDIVQYALTMVKDKQAYLNSAGLKLTIAEPNIENDVFQQFTFGKNEWNTVIDSVQQQGMVWDVADGSSTNPPSGTPFYLFPFHGRNNQHFVFKDGMIFAQQNNHVVTFVGGDKPFVMMPPSNQLKARQTFVLKLL